MQYQSEQAKPQTTPDRSQKKLDSKEMNRLLMRYQGIFKNNITEFAKRNAVISSRVKNYAR